MNSIIRCRDVKAGDIILIGNLVFHVKHAALQDGPGGLCVMIHAHRANPSGPRGPRERNRWLRWSPDATVTRVDQPEAVPA